MRKSRIVRLGIHADNYRLCPRCKSEETRSEGLHESSKPRCAVQATKCKTCGLIYDIEFYAERFLVREDLMLDEPTVRVYTVKLSTGTWVGNLHAAEQYISTLHLLACHESNLLITRQNEGAEEKVVAKIRERYEQLEADMNMLRDITYRNGSTPVDGTVFTPAP